MPEIKHNFTGGKMNKDLDERLVPNGQYRDAMNIQVSTSEGSDVGTAQNILGNSLVSGQDFISENAVCVGSIADEKNDKLYYFIDNKEEILEGKELTNSDFWNSSTSITEDYTGTGVLLRSNGGTAATPNYPSWRHANFDLVDGQTYKLKVKFSNIDDGGTSFTKFFMVGRGSGNSSYRPYYNLSYNNVAIEGPGEYTNIFTFDQSLNNNVSTMSFYVELTNGSTFAKTINVDSVSLVTNYSNLILEHDSVTNSITPVLVDTTQDVLKFDENNIITGINIIDDMLFWTDNHSEPKKINIPRCIEGTDESGIIHTKLINESRGINTSDNIDLEEKHITVIRKSPKTAPTIQLISERDPGFNYSGVMRITNDPGGLVLNGSNFQNASSLWFNSTNKYNHLYDFSQLKVGDTFRTKIETTIDGDSGFVLDWESGDVVVFKEFGGDTYSDAPAIPITDYTIKAQILTSASNPNVFIDGISEITYNGNFNIPNSDGSRPKLYEFSGSNITYDSNPVDSKIIYNSAAANTYLIGTPSVDFVTKIGTQTNTAGTYKVRIEIANMTAGSGAEFRFVKSHTIGNSTAEYLFSYPGVLQNGVNEAIMVLDYSSGAGAINAPALDGKFIIRSSTASSSFEILSISIERQDVIDAGVKLQVLGINGTPSMVPDGYSELRYAVDLLDEEENLFEFKFPRFAYRYQYEDKEYSAFSPFTDVAFLPGTFDFHPQKGYNLGMTNRLKKIKIHNFIPDTSFGQDVVAVDILYKDEVSPNIYVIDTIKPNQHGSNIWNNNQYTINSESVKQVLPSNQLLRPWDSVPKKALAQEVSGNRIIYGNYTQGFDLFKPNSKKEYYPDFNFNIQSSDIRLSTVKSIKSLREYQLGVVFVDKYGRETPVISNTSGLDKVAKKEAAKTNRMEVSFGSTVFPENMEYFKFFVKETSGEYYNMAMDRWWDAGDGLAWLSFGSADINKIDIDTFLILKKGVASNSLVDEQARYKVLAIETDAPDYIKTKKLLIEEKEHVFVVNGADNIFENTVDNAPLLARDTFKMNYKPFASGSGSELHYTNDGILYLEFALGGVVSKRYRVTQLTSNRDQDNVNVNDAIFTVKLEKLLGDDVNFITDDPNDGLNATKILDGTLVRFYKYTSENSSEFDGRFFVKVISDGVFGKYINKTNTDTTQYRSTLSRKLYYMGDNQANLHSELLTGQDVGVYRDSPITSDQSMFSPTADYYTNENNFGRFAPFFRNYRWPDTSAQLDAYTNFGNPTPLANINVGQYRFDSTSTEEWTGELAYHTAVNIFKYGDGAYPSDNNVSLKIADHGGLDDADADADKRYGVFNEDGEQTRGNVWFIDGGPFSGNRSATDTSIHWRYAYDQGGTSVNSGVTNSSGGPYARMKIAMGGIYNPEINYEGNVSISDFFNIGTEQASGGWYSGKKFKDLVGKIQPSIKFRFREDPAGEVYTIAPSGVTYENYLRWSDGGIWRDTNGDGGSDEHYAWINEDPYENSDGQAFSMNNFGYTFGPKTPQLSPNFTRGYHTRFINDRLGDGTVTWDPTNGGVTGPIPNGLNLTVAYASSPPTGILSNQVYVTDIHDITCSVHQKPYSITKGMILTSYGSVLLNATLPLTTTTYSYEPLIVSKIEAYPSTGSILGYVITLVGYSSPLIQDASGPIAGTNSTLGLKQHRVFSTYAGHNSPAAGDSLVFQQPAMNGYSQYSVNRINVQNANGQTGVNSWVSPTGGVRAVGYTIEFLEEIEKEIEFPDNPAIWETEPKETTDLDIYYEASGYNPLRLTEENKSLALPLNTLVVHVENPSAKLGMTSNNNAIINDVGFDAEEEAMGTGLSNSGDATGWFITINGQAVFTMPTITWNSWGFPIITGSWGTIYEPPLVGGNYINIGDHLLIHRPDGSSITVTVKGWKSEDSNGRAPHIFIEDALHGPDTKYTLNWYNCYSFGNGVESNRVRDTYNLPFIANGVKASTTLDENPYEEILKYGLIYSGIYNGAIGINNLNQFIAAENITKNINPTYGSIQKLKAGWGQGGDLITLCEDRVLKILANKDALFNADGNSNLTSTNNVLGQAIPYSGEYGISKNPESFASEAYRAYFTDKVRGVVMRLSMDGLTPISSAGMKDWFRDNLKLENKIIGSYDDREDEYNVTLPTGGYTVSYKEDVKGWVSFKSFVPENALSTANNYYTILGGKLYKHYVETVDRNTFYDAFTNSSLDVILNDIPSSIKSYHTLEYEGSQSRVEGIKTVNITGIEHSFGSSVDGRYAFFEIDEMNTMLNAGWHESIIDIKQYRDDTLVYEGKARLWDNTSSNSLTSPSGGPTKGHLRRNSGATSNLSNSNAGDFEVGDVVTTQSQEDSVDHFNSTPTSGWYVSNIKTNKEKGSLLEFIEKEGKWFNYIKGLESQIDETTDFGSFDIQGLGIIETTIYRNLFGTYPAQFNLGRDLNASLQVGDTIYYESPSQVLGDDLLANITDSDWSVYGGIGTPWTVNSGVFQAGTSPDYGYVEAVVPEITQGNEYEIKYTITSGASGQFILANHGTSGANVGLEETVGTHTKRWIQGSNNVGKIKLWNDSAFNGVVENISVKQVITGQSFGFVRLESDQLQKAGVVTDISGNSIIVEEGSGTPPVSGDYIFFVKNQVVNMNGLSGYYADAKFENNSKVKAELFVVSSEITESSK